MSNTCTKPGEALELALGKNAVSDFVGAAKLDANGTLASFTVPHLSPGVHFFHAEYPGDRYYCRMEFGLVL